jgi:hypothetical protein
VAFGRPPPSGGHRHDELLFGKEGMKIVCGGTTGAIAARYCARR